MPDQINAHTLWVYLMPAVLALLIYRRIRRNFGRQLWRPRRANLRFILSIAIACLLLMTAVYRPQMSIPMGIGATIGALLAGLGLKHTHAAWSEGQRTYTPNPWIGGILTVLLLGRLLWRFFHGGGLDEAQRNPSGFTLGVACALIGYSLLYTGGLILRMRKLGLQAPQPTSQIESNSL